MGNFEKLSVLVIVVIIVMILVVALYTWTDNPDQGTPAERSAAVGPSNMPRGGSGTPGLDDWEKEFGQKGKGSEPDNDTPPIPEPPVPVPQPQPPTPEPQPQPQPAPEPQPQPAAQEWMYTVKAGDTITEISERELTTWKRWKEIVVLNPDANPNALRVGQVLKMPSRTPKADLAVKPPQGDARPVDGGGGHALSIVPGEQYVVRSGDRLSTIAKRAYGSIDRWPELWARNLSAIDDPDSPPVGAKIFIPK